MSILNYFSKDVVIGYHLLRELVGVNTPFNPLDYEELLDDFGLVTEAGLTEIVNGGGGCPAIYILIPVEDLTVVEIRRNAGY